MISYTLLEIIGGVLLAVIVALAVYRHHRGRPLLYPFIRKTSGTTGRMKVYLDIDGTLIHEDIGPNFGEPAAGLPEFLRALERYDVYWLTTHCMDGNPERAARILKSVTPQKCHPLIDAIKPTEWRMHKSEALDLKGDFLWFENDPSPEDLIALRDAGALQSLVKVDLTQRPEHLVELRRRVF